MTDVIGASVTKARLPALSLLGSKRAERRSVHRTDSGAPLADKLQSKWSDGRQGELSR